MLCFIVRNRGACPGVRVEQLPELGSRGCKVWRNDQIMAFSGRTLAASRPETSNFGRCSFGAIAQRKNALKVQLVFGFIS